MEDFLVREKVRAATYQLLADCYKMQPELNEDNRIDNLCELLSLVSGEAAGYAEMMNEEMGQHDVNELKFDFLNMFVGPKTLLAPPYGSVYMEENRQIMGVSTRDAMRLYHEAGYKKAEDFKEPSDHIRIELEFMSTLIQQTMEACEKSEWTEARGKIELQIEFLSKHLASWIKPFTNNVIANAKTGFYMNLAKATESFIRQDYTEDTISMEEEFKELTQLIN